MGEQKASVKSATFVTQAAPLLQQAADKIGNKG